MLWAVLEGKVGRVGEDGKRVPLRSLYTSSEDLLTASVFERLAYLPPHHFIGLMVSAFGLQLPFLIEPELKIEFWPKWSEGDEDRKFVEPDILIRISDGASRFRHDIVVEVKANQKSRQGAGQWKSQIKFYTESVDDPLEAISFIALGGLGTDPESQTKFIKKQVGNKDGLKVTFRGSSWLGFRERIEDLRGRSGVPERLMDDIMKSLDLAGHHSWKLLGGMERPAQVDFAATRIRLARRWSMRA